MSRKRYAFPSLLKVMVCSSVFGSLALAGPSPAEYKPLHENFEQKFSLVENAEGTVSGSIAPGWSVRADQHSRIRLMNINDSHRGLSAQRINIHQGQCQIQHTDVYNVDGEYVLLSIALRSMTGSPVMLQLISTDQDRVLWEAEPDIRPEWRNFEYFIPAHILGKAFIFEAKMNAPGTYDLDELIVKDLTDDYERQLRKFSPPLTKNLLTASSFPNGVHGYWTTGFEAATADPDEIGPTGVPALALAGNLVVPPFVGKANTDYTLSFYARSRKQQDQKLKVQVGDGTPRRRRLSRENAEKTFELSDDWQRYSYTVTLWPTFESWYFLTLGTLDDPVYLDGLQLEEGSQATAFQRTGRIEVAAKTDRTGGLFTEGESLSFSYSVHGNLEAGMQVRSTITDVLGKSIVLDKDIDPDRGWSSHPVTIDDERLAGFGTYRVLLHAVDASGEEISRKTEILLHRVREPRIANQKAQDSPFGIHISPDERQLKLAKTLGFNWVRAHNAFSRAFNWYYIEQERDRLDFGHTDEMMDRVNRNHLMMLGSLETAPPFYSNCPEDFEEEFWRKYFIFKDEYIPQWQRYCRQIVDRYKDDITYWELWNEPFVTRFFKWTVDEQGRPDGIGTPEDYANMAKVTYPAVKEANPDAVLIGQTTIPRRDDGEAFFFHEKAVEAGLYEYVDAHGFHFYTTPDHAGFPDDRLAGFMPLFESVFPEGRRIPQWDTEGSFSGSDIFNYYTTIPPDRMEICLKNAKQIVRYFISIIANGYEKFFVYTFHYVNPWEGGWSMLNGDYSLPPHATSVSSLAWQVEGKAFEGIISPTENIHVYLFRGETESVGILLPKGYVASEITAIPGWIDLKEMYGNRMKLPVTIADDIFYLNFDTEDLDATVAWLEQLSGRVAVTAVNR